MKPVHTLVLFCFIISNNSCKSVDSGTYYVSNSGSDHASGNSPKTAWKTISKVNSVSLAPGNKILFEAGSTWRETLKLKPGSKGAGNSVKYGRYGSGNNPVILGSEKVVNWKTTSKPQIWQASGTFSNLREYYPAEIFFVTNDSTTWGDFQDFSEDFSNLTEEFDWTWNNNNVYIFSVTDPNQMYGSVEVPQRDRCITAENKSSSYIEVNGIDLFYSKRTGFYSGYPEVRGATDLTFRNCNIGYIGVKGGASAYGIAAFHSNFLIDSCNFSDCGRRAISFNLYTKAPKGEEINVSNVIVRNSTFKRGQHTTALDLAMTDDCIGDTIQNVYFYNNIIDDSNIRMQGEDETSNQIFTQEGSGYINSVYIFNNLFIAATARNILIQDGDSIYIWNNTILGHNLNITSKPYAMVSFSGNQLDYRNNINYDPLPDDSRNNFGILVENKTCKFTSRDYNLYFQAHASNLNRNRGFTGGVYGYYTTTRWKEYLLKNAPWDANSPTPQNPEFFDFEKSDFRLKDSSVAKKSGVPIDMVKTDLAGIKRNPVNPSIGAFE